MSIDTQLIVNAIDENGRRFDELSNEMRDVAKAVHELAINSNHLQGDVDELRTEVADVKKSLEVINSTVQTQQSTINIVNKIGDLVLKWIVPIALLGSVAAGIGYTALGN